MTPPAGQRWTRSTPTAPGWYWWRRSGGKGKVEHLPRPVQVWEGGGVNDRCRLWTCITHDHVNDVVRVADQDGEWQGPLIPNEATE